MRIRYLPADPAGNLTGFVLTPIAPEQRAQVAARLMQAAGMEQVAFIDEASLSSPLPRMDMMGGEFCGNATRAFGLYAAQRRGLGERELLVSVSGAKESVPVALDPARGRAFARMPLPYALERVELPSPQTAVRTASRAASLHAGAPLPGRRSVPVVRMEGIAHAVLLDTPPSPALAQAVLAAMPREDAQGVLFAQGERMTPLVFVAATGTSVWESSCGSGSVALAWLLARSLPDGEHAFSFKEPGGVLEVSVCMRAGRAASATMGGRVTLGSEREIEL